MISHCNGKFQLVILIFVFSTYGFISLYSETGYGLCDIYP